MNATWEEIADLCSTITEAAKFTSAELSATKNASVVYQARVSEQGYTNSVNNARGPRYAYAKARDPQDFAPLVDRGHKVELYAPSGPKIGTGNARKPAQHA